MLTFRPELITRHPPASPAASPEDLVDRSIAPIVHVNLHRAGSLCLWCGQTGILFTAVAYCTYLRDRERESARGVLNPNHLVDQ